MFLRIYFILFIVAASLYADAQVKIAAFAGPQATTAHYSINGQNQDTKFKLGVMAGLGLKVPFEGRLYFFPAVYYSLKGYKVTLALPAYPPTELAKNNNTTIHTMEIAPLFQVDLSKKPDHFFVRFGAAVDIAIAGKEKFDTVGTTSTNTVERPMVFSYTEYGRFTASANIHLGYETSKGLMLFAWYAHGIGSLNNADYGPNILHRIAGVSVGWYFATKQ